MHNQAVEALRSLFTLLGTGSPRQRSWLFENAQKAGALSVDGSEPERELVEDGLQAMLAMLASSEPSERITAIEMCLEMKNARKMALDQSVVE